MIEDDSDPGYFSIQLPRDARPQQPADRLTQEDCANPMFDRRPPVRRSVNCRGKREPAYEWETTTDEFIRVGLTYFLGDGLLSVVAFEPRNLQLYEKVVKTPDEFAAAMKEVDRTYKRLTRRAPPPAAKTHTRPPKKRR